MLFLLILALKGRSLVEQRVNLDLVLQRLLLRVSLMLLLLPMRLLLCTMPPPGAPCWRGWSASVCVAHYCSNTRGTWMWQECSDFDKRKQLGRIWLLLMRLVKPLKMVVLLRLDIGILRTFCVRRVWPGGWNTCEQPQRLLEGQLRQTATLQFWPPPGRPEFSLTDVLM